MAVISMVNKLKNELFCKQYAACSNGSSSGNAWKFAGTHRWKVEGGAWKTWSLSTEVSSFERVIAVKTHKDSRKEIRKKLCVYKVKHYLISLWGLQHFKLAKFAIPNFSLRTSAFELKISWVKSLESCRQSLECCCWTVRFKCKTVGRNVSDDLHLIKKRAIKK